MTHWWSPGRSEACSLAALAGAAMGLVVGSVLGWTDLGLVSCVLGAVLFGGGAWLATRGRPEPESSPVPAVLLLVAFPVLGGMYVVGDLIGVTSGFTAAAFVWFMGALALTLIVGRIVSDLIEGRPNTVETPRSPDPEGRP